MRRSVLVAAAMLEIALAQTAFDSPALAQTQAVQPRNIVLFIADGLRFCMVDDNTAPTVAAMARQGVTLRNGHPLFPTFTMANPSGMATAPMLGDTGTYSNTIYTGFEVPGAASSLTPFLESDVVLGDIDEHFAGGRSNDPQARSRQRLQHGFNRQNWAGFGVRPHRTHR